MQALQQAIEAACTPSCCSWKQQCSVFVGLFWPIWRLLHLKRLLLTVTRQAELPLAAPRAAQLQWYHPAQGNSCWKVPQEVSTPTSTSRQGQPRLLMALSSLEAPYIPPSKSL